MIFIAIRHCTEAHTFVETFLSRPKFRPNCFFRNSVELSSFFDLNNFSIFLLTGILGLITSGTFSLNIIFNILFLFVYFWGFFRRSVIRDHAVISLVRLV